MEIIINESFTEDDFELFEKIENNEFEAPELMELRVSSQEISKDSEINELFGYDLIKKNLSYKLPYQIDGALKILKDLNGSALLADEVGLGKTITSGLVVKECLTRDLAKSVLILTPPSLVDQWVSELKEKFELDFKIIEKESDWENTELAIASIDRVKNYDKTLKKFKHSKVHEKQWDIVMIDEAHKLKERNTVRWKFVDKIQKKRFLLLTATPFQNDLIELYNLLHLMKKGHLGTIKEFRQSFLNHGNKRYPVNPKELRKKLQEVMVRRKRDETGINYMKRIPRIISVEQTSEEKQIYEDICDLLKTKYFACDGEQINGKLIIFALLPKVTSSSRSAIESLTRIANEEKYHIKTRELAQHILDQYKNLKKDSKIEKLIEIVKEIRTEDASAKILIYTKHPTTLDYIVEKLKPFNLKIMEFKGGLTREEKTERINEFRASADILISTDTGAEGLNLQFCNNLINYDLPWNPMSVEQRIGRLDRIGQKKNINVYSFATKGTMEEYIVDLIINKMCCVGLVIGELPIILFNLGLDQEGNGGTNKIEEKLMEIFIDSKNNLELFAKGVEEISKVVQQGINQYKEIEKNNKDLLDEVKN